MGANEMLSVVWLSLLASVFAVHASAEGICEQGRIPLRTFWLDDESAVCVVPFCGEEEQRRTPDFEDGKQGSVTCMKCDQSTWQGSAVDYFEKTDVCPTELGACEKGFCCPKEGSNTWYSENFGKSWKGMNSFPYITVTTYGGSTACGGEVAEAEKYLKEHVGGIDAIAAVPSQMYGSWISNQRAGSQACYVNNNICYKITDWNDKEWTIAIWGKCGGYTQCVGKATDPGDPPPEFYSQEVTIVDDAMVFDANKCLNQPGVNIATGNTPDCMSVNGGDGKDKDGKNCCPHPCQQHVDWCGANDHPHFDIGEETYAKICNHTPCTVKKVVPILCPWNPPLNPAYGDWTPRFTEPKQPGSAEAERVHEPYPAPTCDDPSGGGSGGPTPPPAVPDCNSVTSSVLPRLENCNSAQQSCCEAICTHNCKIYMANGCAEASNPMACVEEAIQGDFCPGEECGCSFAEIPA